MSIEMPSYLKLSKEQKDIIDFAGDGNMLIEGPPGSGKTVVALWRGSIMAKSLNQEEGSSIDITVLMHNNTLQKYTDSWNAEERHKNLKVRTHRSWFCNKYTEECRKNAPKISSVDNGDASNDDELREAKRIDLNCPYEDKDLAKARGARFDFPKKIWWITGTTYSKDPDFWKQWSPGAGVSSNYSSLDWSKFFEDFREKEASLGQIIIDEGQDFSPKFYDFLSNMSLLHKGNPSSCCITICADENQRINAEENSTLRDIRERLFRSRESNIFPLTKNYRNTRQTALLARQFYESLPTGVPELPKEMGDANPKATSHADLNAQAKYIFTYMQNHAKDSAMVLSATRKETEKICNELHSLCRSGQRLNAFGYASGKGNKGYLHIDGEDFNVHQKGSIVCLCTKSMKGLESDHVFVVNAHSDFSAGSGDYENENMTLYVMCSRARKRLELLYSGDANFSERSLLKSIKAKSVIEVQNVLSPVNKIGITPKSVDVTLDVGDESLDDVRLLITGLPAYGELISKTGAVIKSTPYILPAGTNAIAFRSPASGYEGTDDFLYRACSKARIDHVGIFSDDECSREDINQIFSNLSVHEEIAKRDQWNLTYYKATEKMICLHVGTEIPDSAKSTMDLIDWE